MPDAIRQPLLPLPYLIVRGRELLGLNQRQLAERLRSSQRTVQRWEARRGTPSARDLHWIADAVRSVDPEIAAHLDVWAPRRAPSPQPTPAAPSEVPAPPTPAPPPPTPRHVLVDSVVCAAAEAMAVAPQAIRAAVLAAFSRSCEARVPPQDVVAELTQAAATVQPPASLATDLPEAVEASGRAEERPPRTRRRPRSADRR